MRNGVNPLRDEKLDISIPPELPVVAVITHLPELRDYHEHRLEIVKAAVKSAFQNANYPHHRVIFDNGSCEALRKWMHEIYMADTVIFSHNVGKMNAINQIYGMFSGSIVAISDDDILHYPNWLAPQIEVLKAYGAGLVTGCVTRHYMKYNHLYAWKWFKEQKLKIEIDDTPFEWDIQHGESIGKDRVFSKMIYTNIPAVAVKYHGVKARFGGCHCQFVGYADTLRPFFPVTNRYMQPLYPVDIAIDEAKLLRLMTYDRLTRHLGNVLTDEDRKEIDRTLE